MLEEYVITLKNKEDLDEFYKDMETLRSTLYNCMPERAVDCYLRRPMSRNTHYQLTEEEVDQLRKDPRVLDIMPTKLLVMSVRPMYSQSGDFNKSFTDNASHTNWGLLRCIEGTQRTNWGSNGTANQNTSIQFNSSGKHVDVIVIDGHIDPAHPEYATGPDNSNTEFVFQNSGFNYSVDGFVDTTYPTLTVVRGQRYYFNLTNVTSSHPLALRLSSGSTSVVPGTTGNNAASGAFGNGSTPTTVIYQVPFDAPSTIVYQCVVHSGMIGQINVVNPTSRVVQLNWFSLNNAAGLVDNDGAALLASNYVYTPYTGDAGEGDNNHGAHVAGTIAGNTQGWARSANIYNINPYGTNPNSMSSLIMWDYIRAFHLNKSVNPATGRKNPTICNGSYGSTFTHPFDYGSFTTGAITRVTYRGVTVGDGITPLTNQQLLDNGIYAGVGIADMPFYSASIAADIQDAIADGIIVVAAAGNESQKIDILGGTDYNNTYRADIDGVVYTLSYHRGTTPGAVPGVICVGSVGSTLNETKSDFSNCGPRIDVYAPGQNINSSKHSGGVTDPRNVSYRLDKISGTSMASPQVCGVLACALETYPNMTPAQAMNYLKTYGKSNQMTDTGGTASDTTALQGSDNRYLFAKKERVDNGNVFPKQNYFLRPATGTVYPRTRIKRYL